MTAQDLTTVLGWSMVINYSVLLIWVLAIKLMPDLVYQTQTIFSSISREDFDRILYRLMGQYKVLMLVTHFGPYVALRIVLG